MGGTTTFTLPGLLLVVVTSTVLGCRHRPPPPEEEAVAASNAEIAIQVNNHNFLDITIYLIHNGGRLRVGIATGTSSATFFLNPRVIGHGGELRLLGDPIGSSEQVFTETLHVQPGSYIEWTLESNLQRSTVSVY